LIDSPHELRYEEDFSEVYAFPSFQAMRRVHKSPILVQSALNIWGSIQVHSWQRPEMREKKEYIISLVDEILGDALRRGVEELGELYRNEEVLREKVEKVERLFRDG
jgi:hypothetical protein